MSQEKILSDWSWQAYDDHGPWDQQLGDPPPAHGWRRVIELSLGPVELLVTEWHFGPGHPAEVSACKVKEIHAVRDSLSRVA